MKKKSEKVTINFRICFIPYSINLSKYNKKKKRFLYLKNTEDRKDKIKTITCILVYIFGLGNLHFIKNNKIKYQPKPYTDMYEENKSR